jgi:hypothetical protein
MGGTGMAMYAAHETPGWLKIVLVMFSIRAPSLK